MNVNNPVFVDNDAVNQLLTDALSFLVSHVRPGGFQGPENGLSFLDLARNSLFGFLVIQLDLELLDAFL